MSCHPLSQTLSYIFCQLLGHRKQNYFNVKTNFATENVHQFYCFNVNQTTPVMAGINSVTLVRKIGVTIVNNPQHYFKLLN